MRRESDNLLSASLIGNDGRARRGCGFQPQQSCNAAAGSRNHVYCDGFLIVSRLGAPMVA